MRSTDSTVMSDRDARRAPRGGTAGTRALDAAAPRSILLSLRHARGSPVRARVGGMTGEERRRGTRDMERVVGKIRIYEIARELGMTSDEVVEKLRARGEPVTSASSTVHAAVADALVA